MLLRIHPTKGIEFDDDQFEGKLVIDFYDVEDEDDSAKIQFDSIEDIRQIAKLLESAADHMERKERKFV